MNVIRKTVIAAAAALALATPAGAQYFGTNKVQYQRFDFKVLATEHFDIYYYPEEAEAVQLAARMAERWYARLSKVMRHELSGRQPLVLYAAAPHFRQTNVLAGEIGEGTGGVTESAKRRVIMPFAGGLAETDHVLGHEIVHAFQYDIAAQRNAEGDLVGPAVAGLPLWFIEGMAEYLSLGPVDSNTAMWVRDASSREKMPTVDRLDDPDFFPYRYGHAFWAYVAGRWGDAAVGDMLQATGQRADIEQAMQTVLGIDKETFDRDWHAETRRTYAPTLETTRPATAFARSAITQEKGGGEMNLSPALSPDGRRVVFLSERSMFSIDMYVADLATGKVTRRLVETATDPHFESIEFIESAGDWAPDNRRFVFAGLSKGRPVLSILDVDSGRRVEEFPLADLDQIYNPAWSPNGGMIAFSALKGGLLDLYVFDLQSRQLTQVTSDAYADHDPEWGRDSRSLVWVTDRFSTDLSSLAFGNYRIGQIDLQTRQARQVAGFDSGRNSNPELSPDGGTLFFVATPDGIPNVYRADLASGRVTRLTNVLSGVSGITPATPALSVAAAATGLVFTVFEDNKYNIYAADTPAQLAGSAVPPSDRDAAVLPPFSRRAGDVARLLETPETGLPPTGVRFEEQPYKARLSLDAVGEPTVGVGADRYGAYAGGGVSFLFSDMLGEHELGMTIQATNRVEEIGGVVAYFNRKHRWNWGLVAEQTPYVTGSFAEGVTTVDGDLALVSQEFRITQVNQAVSGLLQYPFSRAQRVEVSGGIRRISFNERLDTRVFSRFGNLIDETSEDLPASDALNLAETSAALVYDTSLMGATGPLTGQRYRFEVSQLAGTLMYSGFLADYRRYFMPVRPFTLAFRGLHFGRYGRDSEDSRLSPLYLGFPGLVRGYDVDSFEAEECTGDGSSSCPAFDRLMGSRMAVVGAELRFPIFGLFSRRSLYGPLPVELALFTDAGVAWTSGSDPAFVGGDRDWARSAGLALRFNAFGYVIGEVDYVRPLDRPGRGWVWQFNLTPGF